MSARDEYGLTARQRLFADEYLVDKNGTQAAIRAGYGEAGAAVQAHILLRNAKITTYLKERSATIAEKLGIDTGYILSGFKTVAERSMQAEPVLDREGKETGEYTFNAPGANKALEMLGKHLGIFAEKVELTGKDGAPLVPEPTNDSAARQIAFMLAKALEGKNKLGKDG